jgi:hypothetical protein
MPKYECERRNNFCKFKMALSDVALAEYSDLGKLIKLGKYYKPTFEEPVLPPGHGLTPAEEKVIELEAAKLYVRKLGKMESNRPRLFGLMSQHMSTESKTDMNFDAKYEKWQADHDPEKLWQASVRTHKADCDRVIKKTLRMAVLPSSNWGSMNVSPKKHRLTGNVVTNDEQSVFLCAGGALPFLIFPF